MVTDDQPRMVEFVTSYMEENGIRTSGCFDGEVLLKAIAARGAILVAEAPAT